MKRMGVKHEKLQVSKEQLKNLSILAYHLGSEESDTHGHFNMGHFYSHPDVEHGYDSRLVYDCYTSACAIGHGPGAGIPKKDYEPWTKYSRRVFGVSPSVRFEAWHFLFDDTWEVFDNTARGAAFRIRYALEHGVPLVDAFTKRGKFIWTKHMEQEWY